MWSFNAHRGEPTNPPFAPGAGLSRLHHRGLASFQVPYHTARRLPVMKRKQLLVSQPRSTDTNIKQVASCSLFRAKFRRQELASFFREQKAG